MRILNALAIAVCMLLVGTSAASAPRSSEERLDYAEDCIEAVPEETSITSVTDDGRESILDVYTILDGVDLRHGQAAMAAAARPYAELNVKLVPTFHEVSFPASGTTPDGNGSIDPHELFDLARAHTGGVRPHGSDVVYVMTSKDLVSSGPTGGAVAGQADCIGGVRYPHRAFAVGETSPEDSASDYWYGSIVAGHEIGHLLGAHHHYANCVQGDPDDIVEYWTPCTLMFNTVTFISRRFSTAESVAVRGHMLAFADDTPKGPPELSPREVSLEIKAGRARGRIEMEKEVAGCLAEAEVRVQIARRGLWVDDASTTTGADGSYRAKLSRSGKYRAFVPEVTVHNGVEWRTCQEAVSRIVTARG